MSNKTEGFIDLDEFTPYLVNVLAHRLSHDLARVYQSQYGIGIPEWRVLAHLSGHAKVSVRDIYDRVSMDKVKVSRAAVRLEAEGFIIKKTHPADQRLVALQLSGRGRALVAKIAPLARAFEDEVLSTLSASERKRFVAVVRKHIAALGGASPVRGESRKTLLARR